MSPSINDFHLLTPHLTDNKLSLKLLSCYNMSYKFQARKVVQNVHNCSYSLCTALKSINSMNISLCPAQCIMTPRAYHSNSGFISIIIIILTTNVYHLLLYHQNYRLNTPHCLNLQSSLVFTNVTVSLSVKYLCFDNDTVIETQTMSAGMPLRNIKKLQISQ
jgi:hypothetical protein